MKTKLGAVFEFRQMNKPMTTKLAANLLLFSVACLLSFSCLPGCKAKTEDSAKQEQKEEKKVEPSTAEAQELAQAPQPDAMPTAEPSGAQVFAPVENCDKDKATALLPNSEQDLTIPEKACVLIEDTLQLSHGLTIMAGAELLFASNSAIFVEESGFLHIQGKADAPVRLRGQVGTPGWWVGVVIGSNHPQNVIEHAIIEDTGSGTYSTSYLSALSANDGSQVSIRDSIFRKVKGHGVTLAADATINAFSGNIFESIDDAPLRTSAQQLRHIDPNNRFAGRPDAPNQKPVVLLEGGTIKEAMSWPALDVPCRSTSIISVEAMLTVSPGVRVEFETDAGLYVSEGGLLAKGSADAKIVFSESSDQQTQWYGVIIKSSNKANRLENVIIENGGRNTYDSSYAANLSIGSEAVVSLVDVELRGSQQYCASFESGAALTEVKNVSLHDCGAALARMELKQLASLGKQSFVARADAPAKTESAGSIEEANADDAGQVTDPAPSDVEQPSPSEEAAEAGEGAEGTVEGAANEEPPPSAPADTEPADAETAQPSTGWIEVEGGYVTESATWPALQLPLRFNDWVYVEAALVLEAGVMLRFGPGVGLAVTNNGSIDARGNEQAPVSMQSADATLGAWAGLRISTSSDANRLSFTQIRGAGGGDAGGEAASIFVESGASLTLEQCLIADSVSKGLLAGADAKLQPASPSTEGGNVFSGNRDGDFLRLE